MNATPTQPQLFALQARHGAELGDRLLQLRKPAQEEIANAAYEEGFINALNMLGTNVKALSLVMQAAGYEQCGGCEEWFPRLELEELENSNDLGILDEDFNAMRCEDCKMAEDDDWAAPPPPEPTTPEEIAAAEAKKQKSREAVIRQEERQARRREILDSIPEPDQKQGTVGD